MKPRFQVVWCVDSPGWGGSEINLLRVWQLLGRRGDTVILNSNPAPQLLAAFSDRAFTILHQRSPNRASQCLPGLAKAFWLVLRFWRRKFVVWAHHSDSNRWLQVMLAAARRDFVVMEQLVPAAESDFAKSRLSLPLKRFVARRARCVILNAHSQELHYRSLFDVPHARILVIPNSRPVAEIRRQMETLKQENPVLRKEPLLQVLPVIICVGRLCPQKNQTTLIKALALLNSETSHRVTALLLGEGEDEEKLRELVSQITPGNVLFKGHQADLWPWLATSDIFVLPSLTEGLPGALIEAMAARLPCVTTDIPGNRELVQHGLTGLLVPPENPAALAAALRTLLENPAAAQRLAEAGYQHVLQHYDETNEALLWRKLFGEICRNS